MSELQIEKERIQRLYYNTPYKFCLDWLTWFAYEFLCMYVCKYVCIKRQVCAGSLLFPLYTCMWNKRTFQFLGCVAWSPIQKALSRVWTGKGNCIFVVSTFIHPAQTLWTLGPDQTGWIWDMLYIMTCKFPERTGFKKKNNIVHASPNYQVKA